VAGGLSAAIATNFVQGLLTVVMSFLILPFALIQVGGMSGLRQSIAQLSIANPDTPDMLSLISPGEINLFFIIVIVINALVGWVTMPETMANCAAGKTEMEGRMGVTVGIFGKRICTIAWMLTGLCAVAMYTQLADADLAYGKMARDLLPGIAPGLIGLFIACMLASVMSTCDSLMVIASALFTENIYKKFFVVGKVDKHYTLIGRIVSALIVILGIFFAFNVPSVVQGLEFYWKVSALMGIAFWVGLFWRRATVAGAWAATLTSLGLLIFTSTNAFGIIGWDFNAHLADRLPAFMLWEGKLYLPWQMIIYLSAGFVVLVVVSLLTRKVPAENLDRLYTCLRTPISPGEPEAEQPLTLPSGVQPGPRNVLVDHPDFEIPRPTLIGILGFGLAWLGVAALIGVVYWIIG
ncbi:MAG: sodium:solute symporter, partial [Phycisphaerae bacterium]